VLRNFVHQLRNDGLVIAEEEILLEGGSLVPEGKCIKLLFYNDEWNKLHMLIGIAKIDQSESSGGSSLEEESRNSVPSVLTGKRERAGYCGEAQRVILKVTETGMRKDFLFPYKLKKRS